MSAATTGQAGKGLTWVKSSYSAGDGGECVEVAVRPGTVHVRDSKAAAGPMLAVSNAGWASFVAFATRH